jgi:hypothetical protein
MKVYLLNGGTQDDVGIIPSFLSSEDERPAAEQFNERYGFGGGWRPFGEGKFALANDGTLSYPEDPELSPLAMIPFRREVIIVYRSGIVAIVQKDGSFAVSRMD